MSTSAPPSPSPSPEQLACLSAAQDDANTSFSNTPVGAPVASCDQHWVSVQLMRQPDQKQRPSWWPAPDKAPYPSEKYRAQITNGATSGFLNGDGAVRFDRIPAGTNKFAFTAFYKDVEDFFKKELQGN